MTEAQADARRALISGAGFAGLTAAFWMRELGYEVTVVETGRGLKKGGTPVDIRDETIEIVRRMGLLDAVRAKSLPPRTTEFVDAAGTVVARMDPEAADADGPTDAPGDGYEIHRDDLLEILFERIDGEVEVLFDDSITSMVDSPDGVRVGFRDGSERDFALVLGCDGNHSTVRRLRFGEEGRYTHFLQNYFSVAIVDEELLEPGVTRILSTPGHTLMLNAYDGSTDIVVTFHADDEIAYDHRDADEQRRILRERSAAGGEAFIRMVEKAESADDLYFDKLSQTRMPTWVSGRVALVGDAGYCASPAAGMGGSLAILGATALHDAFATAGGDIEAAFREYETSFRPVAERIQDQALAFGLPAFFPETQEAIDARNAMLAGA